MLLRAFIGEHGGQIRQGLNLLAQDAQTRQLARKLLGIQVLVKLVHERQLRYRNLSALPVSLEECIRALPSATEDVSWEAVVLCRCCACRDRRLALVLLNL